MRIVLRNDKRNRISKLGHSSAHRRWYIGKKRYCFLFFFCFSFAFLSQPFEMSSVRGQIGFQEESGFKEEFNDLSLSTNWFVNSFHGSYTLENSILNLRSADQTNWASISIQSNCTPSDNGFKLRARVRSNGGYGVYFALFVSNQTFVVSKEGQENAKCTRNTIAVCNDYDAFRVCRGTSSSANHWSWFNIASVGTVGNWYILELNVSKNPYNVTANVYNDDNVLIGSGIISDMILQYSEINTCGVAVWRGVGGDALANYDVDWILGENLEVKELYSVKIDKVYVSNERADVGDVQTAGFHAQWSDNDSDVVEGYLFVNGTQYVTNGTGWLVFDDTLSTVGKKTWIITSVDCNKVTDFTSLVSPPTIIWDRIKIVDGGTSQGITELGNEETIWFKAVYEYDNNHFDGSKGTLFVNSQTMTWSDENMRWEYYVTSSTQDKKEFQVSGADEKQFELTLINDAVGSLSIEWRPFIYVWLATNQSMVVAVIAVATVSMVGTGWRIKKRRFEREQLAKGLVKHKGRWGTPEKIQQWRKEECRRSRLAKCRIALERLEKLRRQEKISERTYQMLKQEYQTELKAIEKLIRTDARDACMSNSISVGRNEKA